MTEPILYLSLWFKKRRKEYYEQLQYVRETGDWEEWTRFFLQGVLTTSEEGVATAKRILHLFENDRKHVEAMLGSKAAPSALKILAHLQNKPVSAVKDLLGPLRLSAPTANLALSNLEKAGVVREITGRRRDRLFAYKNYLSILEEGTEPLTP